MTDLRNFEKQSSLLPDMDSEQLINVARWLEHSGYVDAASALKDAVGLRKLDQLAASENRHVETAQAVPVGVGGERMTAGTSSAAQQRASALLAQARREAEEKKERAEQRKRTEEQNKKLKEATSSAAIVKAMMKSREASDD